MVKKRKKPTGNRQKFIDNYINNGGNQVKAATDAGYSLKGIAVTASQLKFKLRDEISAQLKHKFPSAAPMAMKVLFDLAEHAEQESVRLSAANGILDRAGYKPVEQREELAPKRDRAALEAELAGLVGRDKATEFIEGLQPEEGEKKEEPGEIPLEEVKKYLGTIPVSPPAEREKPKPAELAN